MCRPAAAPFSPYKESLLGRVDVETEMNRVEAQFNFRYLLPSAQCVCQSTHSALIGGTYQLQTAQWLGRLSHSKNVVGLILD